MSHILSQISVMNRQILHIAIPSIISNVTVPLLALVDTTIVGHLGAAAYIGAIAVGGLIFNMIYWLFNFLRMGTGGLTAQAYGAGRQDEALRVMGRSLSLAAFVGAALILLQWPLGELAFRIIDATPQVQQLAHTYYAILIWGAPAVLGLYSFTGWFLGMQNARYPMLIAIVQNVVNVVASLAFVCLLGWKVEGVAAGSLLAQYVGLGLALWLWVKRYRPFSHRTAWSGLYVSERLKEFFHVNRDIFLRTLCLICVTTTFTSVGASQGDLTLAANALLMQFFMFFSYVMDGFAYAGEAIGGRCCGAHDGSGFKTLTRHLFVWGIILALGFTLVYAFGGHTILSLLTDERQVVHTAAAFLPYAVGIPFVGMSAFVFDGLFIGTTSTRLMLLSMFFAMCAFFLMLALLPEGNVALWTAFLVYLGSRGAVQALLFPKIMRRIRG